MAGKITVFATSFLDNLITSPIEEGKAIELLKSAALRNNLELEFRCDRDYLLPMTAEELEGAVAVIADLEKYDKELFSKTGPNGGGSLGLVARYGIGYNNVDIGAAAEAGILVSNTPGANALPTAEWSVSTLMTIAGRRIPHHERAAEGKGKIGPSRLDISNKTLGIIGTGNIGKRVAALLEGYNMKILASDPYPDKDWAEKNNVKYVDIPEICREADFITLHASVGKELIGKEHISLMNSTTVLINCARGVLVDNRAVYESVKDGKLWGYGIDEVWEYEDLPLSGLNITASPHVGSDTDTGKINMQMMSAQAVIDFVDGKKIPNIVTP